MLKSIFTKAPLWAVLTAILLFAIVAGAGLGLAWPTYLAGVAILLSMTEAVYLWILIRKNRVAEHHLRQFRFIAERFQSLLRAAPCGYCLFTPQGLLREETGAAALLGLPRVTHLDDLIGAVTQGPELLASFRRLQSTGTAFILTIEPVAVDKPLQMLGRRFRVGREGPHVDVLWLWDPEAMKNASLLKELPQPSQAPLAEPPETQPQTTDHKSQPADYQSLTQYFDGLPFPVWGRDENLQLVFCNSAYSQAATSNQDNILQKQLELMAQESKAGKALAKKALEEKKTLVARDHAVVNKRRRLLQITEKPYSLPHTPLALLGFAIDVTAEEEKESELRRHLVSHHEVLEHLGAAIAVYGADQRLEFYNRAFLRMWESQEAFLDGKPTFSEVLEDTRARRKLPEQADFQKYKKGRLALFTSLLEPQEDVLYLPDETSLRVLTAPHPLGGLMFVYENITDQLALETSYNTLMAVQKETLDNLAEGIAVFGPDGRLRLSNPAWARLWGLPADFAQNQPHVAAFFDHVKPLLDEAVTRDEQNWQDYKADMIARALDRTPHTGRIELKDQTVIDYLTVPLPDGAVLNSYLDVSAQMHIEHALRASNVALATADRLKSDFVANVSYQLRTPLNTITGFAEILAEQYFGKLNERQLEYTTTIRAESEKLTRLINDVLDLATIEAGRMTLDRSMVSVASLVNEAKLMTAAWARQQMIEILVDCPSDIGNFEVDEQRIKQVLFNLISNAIKYTPAGGHIAIATWRQEPWIVLSVLDTGVGIPECDRERVFGKFEKSNAHLRQAGAGLGLSLVKSFVELHGGRVEIFSDDKEGTRISCFLPIHPPAQDHKA
ncbi:MAG: PAS-domain containing protein [Alphaproteobacteria bacterium]|nr:PAS-domain containing protein [Alphaproteobacteria bacterium]